MPSLPADLPLTGLLAALGAGLLIGIERERNKGSGALRALAGVRSFTLAALAGAIAQALAQPLLVAAGAVLILALIAIAYRRARSRDPGVTTEIALFVTYLLGVAAIPEPAGAAAGAVLVATLLAARSRIHRFAVEVLSADELRDALILAGSALVLLPLLPAQPLAWLGGLNPRSIWALAVVMMALQGAGYIAQRWLGARRGLALAGLAAGFVSSTAAIAATGVRVKSSAAKLDAGVASALFSTLATYILFAIIAATVHAPSLRQLALPLAAGFVVTALAAGLFYLRAHGGHDGNSKRGRAFDPWQATLFSLGLAVLTAIVGLVSERYGSGAAQGSAALAGFADAHAAGASVLALAASGRMAEGTALWACLFAISTNAGSKCVAAFLTGGAAYGLRVGAGLLAGVGAAWLTALLGQ